MRLDHNKKPFKKASSILTADWHLRDTQPKCRTDEYYEAQWKKIKFIRGLQIQHKCPVLLAGDVFDVPKPSPMLLAAALHFLPDNVICIPGQHDLPGHSLENLNQSGLFVLKEGSNTIILNGIENDRYKNFFVSGFPWGSDLSGMREDERTGFHPSVAMVHTLVQGPKETNQNIPYGEDCFGIFKTLPGYDLIVSGDNHKSFFVRDKSSGNLLVNPGSLMRMSADQEDYKPCVYLWYAEDNTVEAVYLPIEKNVISREHIEKQTKEDERMEAYKAKLKAGVKIGISFEKNMKQYLLKNKTGLDIEKEIYAAMEGKGK